MPEFDKYAQTYEELLHDPIREKFAPGSDFFFARKWELLRDYMAHSGIDAGKSAWLDVGCGKGDLLRLGAPAFERVAGCDVSGGMMEDCGGIEVALQPAPAKLPYADNSFDLITAVCVYHHVELADRPGLTQEFRRVLKPGGTACIIEHNPFNPVTRLIVSRTPVDADAKLLTAGTSIQLLRQAGLIPVRTTYFLYFPEGLYRKLGAMEHALSSLPAGGQYASFARKP
jgi:ubiquinone/menaquinone biosynthesis C-methylase UbiE